MKLEAPAKVNLVLEVLGKRSDGYHQVATVLQAIDVVDHLYIEEAERLNLECNYVSLESPDNLVLRAAELLRKATGCSLGAKMRLQKGIPMASGMGGGSSDAASVLKGLNQLWRLGLGEEVLSNLAEKLGSDVPFFLSGGSALALGRGEEIQPLGGTPELWLVLVYSRTFVAGKTARLYSMLDTEDFTSGAKALEVARRIREGKALSRDLLWNTFDRVALEVYPGLKETWASFKDAGAPFVHLVGSGPTLYTVLDRETGAKALAERLVAEGIQCQVARPVPG